MLKIGLVQLDVIEGDIEGNRRHIQKLVSQYVSDNLDLLCFPELCISGYDFAKAKISKDEKDFFAELSKEYRIALLAGVNVYEKGKFYDAVCMWDEEGKMIGEYRKIHLWDQEYGFFEPGEDLVVIPFHGWKIGILICADLRFFEVSTPLKNMGADLIIYPSAWIAGWRELFHLCARMRAAENQIYTIILNRASEDKKYCGGTALIGPDGIVLRQLKQNEEGYLNVELHKERLEEMKIELAWETMKRPKVYQKYEKYRFQVIEDK